MASRWTTRNPLRSCSTTISSGNPVRRGSATRPCRDAARSAGAGADAGGAAAGASVAGRLGASRRAKQLPSARRIELPGGLEQVGRVDDVVAIEHLAGLPADQLHRDPFGHAGTDEVSDGGPAEVVEHMARHAGGATGRRPCLVEATERRPVGAREDMRDAASEFAFAGTRDRPPSFEQRAEGGSEREHAAFAGLRGAGIEPDLTGVEVDARPAETGCFGSPSPPRDRKSTRLNSS